MLAAGLLVSLETKGFWVSVGRMCFQWKGMTATGRVFELLTESENAYLNSVHSTGKMILLREMSLFGLPIGSFHLHLYCYFQKYSLN